MRRPDPRISALRAARPAVPARSGASLLYSAPALLRARLGAGEAVQVGVLRFQGSYTDEEAAALVENVPNHWLLRLGPNFWSQEVLGGTEMAPGAPT
jgi:hypothetical protein